MNRVITTESRTTTLAGGIAAAVVALAMLAGCGSGGGVKTEVPVAAVTPEMTASPTPTSPSEDEEILSAYRGFFDSQTAISAAPADERREKLEPFATDPVLSRVLGGMFAADGFGEVAYGAPVLDPEISNIEGDTATVVDCQDTSETGRKKRKTGKIVTRGLTRDKVETTMRRDENGSWRVATVHYLDGSC